MSCRIISRMLTTINSRQFIRGCLSSNPVVLSEGTVANLKQAITAGIRAAILSGIQSEQQRSQNTLRIVTAADMLNKSNPIIRRFIPPHPFMFTINTLYHE